MERLRKRAQELENEVTKLNRIIDEAKLQESRVGERALRLEVNLQPSLWLCEKETLLYIYNHNSEANVTWTSRAETFFHLV